MFLIDELDELIIYELCLNKALIFLFKVISFQIEFSCITIETKKIKHLYAQYDFVNHGAWCWGDDAVL